MSRRFVCRVDLKCYVTLFQRPAVDEFMKRMGELFEVVIFTASLSKVNSCLVWLESWSLCSAIYLLHCSSSLFLLCQYADPVMDRLDIHHVVASRLFREACSNHQGVFVKVRSCSLFFASFRPSFDLTFVL